MKQIEDIGTYNIGKRMNEYVVLNLIRKKRSISKSQIARISGLSRPTVDEFVDILRKKKFVKQAGFAPSRGGRKPILWKFNNEAAYIMGIDMESPHVTVILTDLELNIIGKSRGEFSPNIGKDKIVQYLIAEAHKVIEKADIDTQKIVGIGVGVPGLINKSTGMSISIERIPGWYNVPIVSLLSQEFDVPVFLEDDASLMAIAEKYLGNGQNVQNMIYVAYRTGIGTGIFIKGELFGGIFGNAGILGHTTISKDGPLCSCGNRGCLELFADEPAIINKAKEGLKKGLETRINTMVGGKTEKITAEIVFEAGLKGDPLALDIVKETGEYLGIGVANLVNLFDTRLIIIGGSVIKAGEPFLKSVKKTVNERLLPMLKKDLKIVYAEVKEDASALGASILVLQNLFKAPSVDLPR